jgi:hypothetical protein
MSLRQCTTISAPGPRLGQAPPLCIGRWRGGTTEAAFRGNSRAGAARTESPSSQPEPTLCPRRRIRSVEFACSGGCNGNNVPSRRGGAPRCAPIPSRCARMRPRVVQRGRDRSRSPCAACRNSVSTSPRRAWTLGRTGRAWLSAERLALSCGPIQSRDHLAPRNHRCLGRSQQGSEEVLPNTKPVSFNGRVRRPSR